MIFRQFKRRRRKSLKMFLKYKKGNVVLDGAMVVVMLTVLSLMMFFGYQMFSDLNTDLQADADLSTEAKAKVQTVYDVYPSTFDGLFMLAMILLWGLVIVASFMVDAHPIFFIFTVLLLVFILFIGAEMSNVFNEVTTDAELNAYRSSFPMTVFLMEHLLLLICVIGGTVLLALYGKSRMEG